MKNLLMLDIVGDLSLLTHSSLQISRSGKMAGPSSEQNHIQGSTIVIEFSLDKGAVNDRHDPLKAGKIVRTIFQLPRQKEVPRKHVLERWWRKGLAAVGQKILL